MMNSVAWALHRLGIRRASPGTVEYRLMSPTQGWSAVRSIARRPNERSVAMIENAGHCRSAKTYDGSRVRRRPLCITVTDPVWGDAACQPDPLVSR